MNIILTELPIVFVLHLHFNLNCDHSYDDCFAIVLAILFVYSCFLLFKQILTQATHIFLVCSLLSASLYFYRSYIRNNIHKKNR
jgi:hypothetical protein